MEPEDDPFYAIKAALDYRREAYGDPCPTCGCPRWGGDCPNCHNDDEDDAETFNRASTTVKRNN